jgi:hypothetical protein
VLNGLGRRGLLVVLAVVVSVGGTAAWASVPSATGVVTGCYYNATGVVRVIDPAKTKCFTGSTQIRWKQQGGQEKAGLQGPPGFPAFATYQVGLPRPASGGPPAFLGPLLAGDESSTLSEGRDGGVSVSLPDGRALWVFGDTPQYQYQHGKWILARFVHGSSAAEVSFTEGSPPAAPFQEVGVGRAHSANDHPTQFLSSPVTYLPDGSGRLCNQANAGPTASAERWPTGGALLPDGTNVFLPFVDVCVTSALAYRVEGWGFAEYDWKANKFSVGATDVFAPAVSGTAIPTSQYMGSPIVAHDTVTLFSETCCSPGSVYTTTIAADVAALADPASYVLQPVSGLPATFSLSVAPPSQSQPHLTMYWASDTRGQYRIFTAAEPSGPWSQQAMGTLPRCDTTRVSCDTIEVHPELSSASQLVVSYNLPGYGPGITTHPSWVPPAHLVWASIPSRD